MIRKCLGLMGVALIVAALPLGASTAEMYFSSDKGGATRVTNVQEGTEVWICLYDPDENIDCDVRDKIWTDVKLMDPKTGASIVWTSNRETIGFKAAQPLNANQNNHVTSVPYKGHYPGNPGSLASDYFEETGADTGIFVSKRPFQIGTRESFASSEPWKGTHVVDLPTGGAVGTGIKDPAPRPVVGGPRSFKWGNYSFLDTHNETKGGATADGDWLFWVGYLNGNSTAFDNGLIGLRLDEWVLPSQLDADRSTSPNHWLIGRFENMDTLIGMVQDQNDETDVAVAMMKIIDTEATIAWEGGGSRGSGVIYKDGNEAATITIVDPDENLNCNRVEVVPVFILVNPSSWNPTNSTHTKTDQTGNSATNFCMLKRTGGIAGDYVTVEDPAKPPTPPPSSDFSNRPIRWFNIYNAEKNDYGNEGASSPLIYATSPVLANARVRSNVDRRARSSWKVRRSPRSRAFTPARGAAVIRSDARVQVGSASARPRGVPRPNKLRITSPRFAALACNR